MKWFWSKKVYGGGSEMIVIRTLIQSDNDIGLYSFFCKILHILGSQPHQYLGCFCPVR